MILNIPGAMLKAHPRDPFGARLERRFPLRCHEGEHHHRPSSQVIGESPGGQQRGQQRQGIHPEDHGQGERGEMPRRFIDHVERRGGASREKAINPISSGSKACNVA